MPHVGNLGCISETSGYLCRLPNGKSRMVNVMGGSTKFNCGLIQGTVSVYRADVELLTAGLAGSGYYAARSGSSFTGAADATFNEGPAPSVLAVGLGIAFGQGFQSGYNNQSLCQ
jgi:hypothetical protein